jgi:arylsulfatase A-like enzyme
VTGEKLNVVVIYLDDIMADMYRWLPLVDADPHGGWTRFARSKQAFPLCGPSRVSMFSGRHPHRVGVVTNPIPLDGNVAPKDQIGYRMQQAGYSTGYAGKVNNGYPWTADQPAGLNYVVPGWDRFLGRRSNLFFNTVYTLGGDGGGATYTAPEGEYAPDRQAAEMVDYVTNLPEPWYAYWCPDTPHSDAASPLDPPKPAPRHANLYADTPMDHRPNFDAAGAATGKPPHLSLPPLTTAQKDEIDVYVRQAWRSMAAIDEGIQAIMDAAAARGVLDRTVIMVLGDNGNLNGGHRWIAKNVHYEEAIDAQLRVRWPGGPNRTSDALVSVADIFPTLLDIAGGRPSITPDGMSFSDVLDGTIPDAQFREDLLVRTQDDGQNKTWILHRGTKKLVYYPNRGGFVERYDLAADPYELSNLGADPDLTRRLETLVAEAGG